VVRSFQFYFAYLIFRKGTVFHVCPVAFRKLVYVNADTLIHAANGTPCLRTSILAVKQARATKKKQLQEWISESILPDRSIDECKPTLFLRCDKYSSLQQVWKVYNAYLSSKFDSTSPLSFCSISTVRRVFAAPRRIRSQKKLR
jgi:hypothetical protein